MGYRHNRKRYDDWLSQLEPTRFEALVGEYFRDQGYRVEHVGASATGRPFDGGIDLKLYRGDQFIIVQCKNWRAMQLTHNAVHELLGVMLTQRATGAIVVTSGEFTAAAITAAAAESRVLLIDGVELRQLLATWPGRSRWSRPPTGIFSGFADASWRLLLGSGVAVLFVAALVVAMVTPRTPSLRNSVRLSSVAAANSADDPGEMSGARYEAIARSQVTEDRVAARESQSRPPDSRSVTSYADRRRDARSGMHAIGGAAHRASSSALGIPDANRAIDPESARLAARRVPGVRSAVWMDQTNFIVRVDSAERRSMATINEVCDALEPLGDTLGVVVALQNANARNGDEMETLTRNCQLGEGKRAFGQRNRQIDTVSPEVRAQFKAMQERNQPKR